MDAADGPPAGVALVLLVCAQRSRRQGWLPVTATSRIRFVLQSRCARSSSQGWLRYAGISGEMAAEVPKAELA